MNRSAGDGLDDAIEGDFGRWNWMGSGRVGCQVGSKVHHGLIDRIGDRDT